MTDEYRVNVSVNPLVFFEADEAWSGLLGTKITTDAIAKYACSPDVSAETDEIIRRYGQITSKSPNIVAAPSDQKILQKLVWPLRHAKAAYMFGNYLSTIAMCGLVAEMVSILLFEISDPKINNRRMGIKEQNALFGSSFENLGQQRRVDVLFAYRIIDEATKSQFDMVRTKRKRYLHLWSEEHEQLANDAVAVYDATVRLVVKVIGQDFRDGKLLLNPALVTYLRRAGVLQAREAAGQDEA